MSGSTTGMPARLAVKVVPGASRDQVAGMLGERLKIRVSAPAEGGMANAAVCRLLANALGIPIRSVSIIEGHTRPEKTVALGGVSLDEVRRRLGMNNLKEQ